MFWIIISDFIVTIFYFELSILMNYFIYHYNSLINAGVAPSSSSLSKFFIHIPTVRFSRTVQ